MKGWIMGLLAWVAGVAPALALGVGDKVPEIAVPSTSGSAVTVGAPGGGWRVVYFYPKSFTPGCTSQACGLRDQYQDFATRGVAIYGVSTDDLDKQNKFKTEHKLPFDLLADKDKALSEAFGVVGLMGFSKRVTFIINPEGVVTDVIDSVSVSSHANDVLALLQQRMNP
jgi:peroxiredoxin Q/BCP